VAKDKYANMAYISVTESTVNTLTFGELETGISLFEKIGWNIHRVNYWLDNATIAQLVAGSDQLQIALTLSNKVTTLNLSDAAVLDVLSINPILISTGESMQWAVMPMIRDFSTMPMGGKLVPPRPIYLAVKATGFASAAIVSCRFEYTTVELKPDDYWELVEAYRLVE